MKKYFKIFLFSIAVIILFAAPIGFFKIKTYSLNVNSYNNKLTNFFKTFSFDNGRTIDDGIYKIVSAVDQNKILTIKDGSINSGADAIIADDINADNQKFDIKYISNGYYILTVVNSNKVLDVSGGYAINGNKVQQWDSNNTPAQKWLIKDSGDGYYNIISSCGGLYLSLNSDNITNGISMVILNQNNKNNQKFKLNKIETVKGSKTLKDGLYEIKSYNTNNVVQVFDENYGNLLQVNTNNYSKNQKFYISYLGNGYYTIKSLASNNVLDVCSGSPMIGNKVQQWYSNNTPAQQWVIKDSGNGYFYIISKLSGLYLTLDGQTKGNSISMNFSNDSYSQKFVFENVDKVLANKTISNGTYNIVSDDKAITVDNGLKLENNKNLKNQEFNIQYMGNGYYQIQAIPYGKVLDVAGGSYDINNKIQLWESNNTDSQVWIIHDNKDGTYSIISGLNELYLTVDDKQNIVCNKNLSTNIQKFKLVTAKKIVGTKTLENGTYQISDSNKNCIGVSNNQNGLVSLAKNINSDNQKVNLKYISNGLYYITFVNSNKSLDVMSGSVLIGAPVQQWDVNNTDAQKWIIQDNKDGTYSIISNISGLFATLKNNSISMQIEDPATTNQKFSFNKIVMPSGSQTLDNGTYQMFTSDGAIFGVDNLNMASRIQYSNNINSDNQKFNIKYLENGCYSIKVLSDGLNMDVAGGSSLIDTPIQQWEENGTDAQKWVIQDNKDGTFSIISKYSGLYITMNSSKGFSMQFNNNSSSQKFKIKKVQNIIGSKTIIEGMYNIETSNNKYLGINNGKLSLYDNNNDKLQQFYVKYLNNGLYYITTMINNKSLDVCSGSKLVNTKLQLWDVNNTDAQQWVIKDNKDGTYSIISKLSNLYMDSSLSDNQNALMMQFESGKSSQKFKFTQSYMFGIDVSSVQKNIDFDKIKNNSNVNFIIARIGYYNTDNLTFVQDTQFERNYKYATSNNIKLGGYLYSYARNVDEAKQEANGLVDYLKKTGQTDFDLPIFFDIEDSTQTGIDKQTQTQMCIEFCKIIQAAGYKAGIYSYLNWYKNYIDLSQIPTNYSIWLAAFGINDGNIPDNNIYKYFEGHDIWQYTSKGKVDGIGSEFVDMDIYYRSK